MLSQRLAKQWRQSQGLTLLEVLLAIAILSITLTTMVTLSITGLRSASVSRDTVVADQYAREGVEIMRALRDAPGGWQALRELGSSSNSQIELFGTGGNDRVYREVPLPVSGVPYESSSVVEVAGLESQFAEGGDYHGWITNDYCNNSSTWDAETARLDDKYYRVIIIGFPNDSESTIRSVVCYVDRGHARSVGVETVLTDWR